jgi:proteasome lid subunit RPN8/RPN11
MWHAVTGIAGRLLADIRRAWQPRRREAPRPEPKPAAPLRYERLERVILADGVGHTLFEQYAAHRRAARGDEETGWFLLGFREGRQAVVLATLPAGELREASATHVRFNSAGQVLGSRIVRQADRRLAHLGLVHTHPGSLRHPSDGDYRGDSGWVRHLRGNEGVFGIGTADGRPDRRGLYAEQPKPNVQRLGELCFSWYSLRQGDRGYRPLPVDVTLGPDLARPLHAIWETIEVYAEQLERLYRQQAGVRCEAVEGEGGPALAVHVPLAEPESSLRVLLNGDGPQYYLRRGEDLFAAGLDEERVDRGVYLMMAELARSDG